MCRLKRAHEVTKMRRSEEKRIFFKLNSVTEASQLQIEWTNWTWKWASLNRTKWIRLHDHSVSFLRPVLSNHSLILRSSNKNSVSFGIRTAILVSFLITISLGVHRWKPKMHCTNIERHPVNVVSNWNDWKQSTMTQKMKKNPTEEEKKLNEK